MGIFAEPKNINTLLLYVNIISTVWNHWLWSSTQRFHFQKVFFRIILHLLHIVSSTVFSYAAFSVSWEDAFLVSATALICEVPSQIWYLEKSIHAATIAWFLILLPKPEKGLHNSEPCLYWIDRNLPFEQKRREKKERTDQCNLPA